MSSYLHICIQVEYLMDLDCYLTFQLKGDCIFPPGKIKGGDATPKVLTFLFLATYISIYLFL